MILGKKNMDIPGELNCWQGGLRLIVLLAALLESRMRFVLLQMKHRGRLSRRQRAEWLRASCIRILNCLSVSLTVQGYAPGPGLAVSNHLSYLDVLFYGATGEYIFVAKSEIRRWPIFGALARAGGAIFVDRTSRLQAAETGREIENLLREGAAVLMFPEATSSDGNHVLPFRSSLFEPAIRTGASITPAAIRYLPSDAIEKRVAYWGSAVLVPHLFQTLRLRHLSAELHFAAPRIPVGNRKTEAEAAWREVVALREHSLARESRQLAMNRASREKQGREGPGIENRGIHPAGHAKTAPAPLDPLATG